MTVFLVVSDEPNDVLGRKILETYPDDHFRISDSQWAIAAEKRTSAEVRDELGVNQGELGRVVVFRTAGASGWFKKGFWEWLAVKEEQE